eukprot:GHVT01014342.1.p1 GENE.GHVT01014342.1~~GHVT01014342.1.p1  ORF type:complete len:216 (+),score=49.86 GHVT01014342.1:961-1608(+)
MPTPCRLDELKEATEAGGQSQTLPRGGMDLIIDGATQMLHKLFALRLRELPRKRNTLELQGNQKSSVRRFCVSQSLKLPQHVAETLDGFDHQLRGFLALLTPCLLVKRGKLTVSEVANVMHSVGRSDLLGNDESEAKAEIARALSARRHFAKPFAGTRRSTAGGVSTCGSKAPRRSAALTAQRRCLPACAATLPLLAEPRRFATAVAANDFHLKP